MLGYRCKSSLDSVSIRARVASLLTLAAQVPAGIQRRHPSQGQFRAFPARHRRRPLELSDDDVLSYSTLRFQPLCAPTLSTSLLAPQSPAWHPLNLPRTRF